MLPKFSRPQFSSFLDDCWIFIQICRCSLPLKDLQLRRHYNLQLLLDIQSASSQPSLYITLYLAKCPALEAAALQQVKKKQLTLLQTCLASCPDLSRYDAWLALAIVTTPCRSFAAFINML